MATNLLERSKYGKHQKVWGNQAAHGSASTDLAPAFSRIPLLELPRSGTVTGSRPDLQHEMRPTVFGAPPN